ncbi:hypothetical protein [Streptomyces sp. NRRL F-5126]|uniref:hypothetical protein n=1 Tax=Streptomyces sp. NRRL F-5126 TaxID=1463857 RepID=UPI00068AE5F9|nr:hypothetical protein [Streptomyces sp. NRRL F-5126]
MRPQLPLTAAAAAACTALALGTAGPAAAAVHTPHGAGHAAPAAHQPLPRAPLPDAATLARQINTLRDAGGVLTPVTDLLRTVAAAKDGKVPAAEANRLGDAATHAITAAKPKAAATGTRPDAAAKPKATVTQALDGLQKSVDALVTAAKAGNATKARTGTSDAVTKLVNVLVADVLAGGLPKPDLPGLPDLPTMPATSTTLPSTSTLPSSDRPATTTLPADVPAVSTLPAPAVPGMAGLYR